MPALEGKEAGESHAVWGPAASEYFALGGRVVVRDGVIEYVHVVEVALPGRVQVEALGGRVEALGGRMDALGR